MNINDKVIIKKTEETGTITNIFNVEGIQFYELEDRVKAYTKEELLIYMIAPEEQRQTFNEDIPKPLDINTPIIKADAIKPDDSFVDKMLGHRIAIEQNDPEQGESSLTINTDPGDEVSTITINQTEYDGLTEDSDILKRVRNLINK
ncbi:hypothetical protein [Macrococcus equi]|uniref:hypothetical protein n=1 Tax=Macrococcus equi TaxID=3395462 RepID=UPI0039BE8534